MLSLSRFATDLPAVLASSGDSDGGSGGGIASIAIFLVIPVAMYFLLIRPQRRRQREQAAQQAGIAVGDEVMTTAGVYGFITGFDGDIVWLEIDDNVQIRVARQAIQRKVDTSSDTSTSETPSHKPDDTGRNTPIADAADASDGAGDQ